MWLTEDWRAANPEATAAVRAMIVATDPKGYIACCEGLRNLDYLKDLGSMTRPTLFVAGADDGAASPDTMRAMSAACPGSLFSEVPDAKHVVNVDRPDGFALAIAGFLALDAE